MADENKTQAIQAIEEKYVEKIQAGQTPKADETMPTRIIGFISNTGPID